MRAAPTVPMRAAGPAAIPLLLGLCLIGACAPGLGQPRVVAGGPTTVSIEGGQWSDAEGVARRHCARFGKRAVAKGHRRSSGRTLANVYIYDCKQDSR